MKYPFCLLLVFLYSLKGIAQGYKLEGNEVRFDKELTFKKGTAELNAEDVSVLKSVKDFLEEKTYISLLRIGGNVQGSSDDQLLSEKRAMAAAQWLVQSGIDCGRLVPVGFGHTKPAGKLNRISFEMASVRGKLIGGTPADGGGHIAGDICKAKTSR